MNHADLIKQFDDVPLTHFFRTLQPIIKADINRIELSIPNSPESMTFKNPGLADTLLEKFITIYDAVAIEGSEKNDPYASLSPKQVNRKILSQRNFKSYEEIYHHFFNYMMPSCVNRGYFWIIRHDLISAISGLTTGLFLIIEINNDRDPDPQDLTEVIDICHLQVNLLKAILDAAADFERQTFDEVETT